MFFRSNQYPGDFTGFIFVGLFPKPIPQGRPTCCTFLPAPDWYLMKSLPEGCYYVFAAAIPLSAEPMAYLSVDSGLLVGMSREPLLICNGKVSGNPDVMLRSPRLTDPPIVLALPFIE
jgi:AraC family transcriptional regulator